MNVLKKVTKNNKVFFKVKLYKLFKGESRELDNIFANLKLNVMHRAKDCFRRKKKIKKYIYITESLSVHLSLEHQVLLWLGKHIIYASSCLHG